VRQVLEKYTQRYLLSYEASSIEEIAKRGRVIEELKAKATLYAECLERVGLSAAKDITCFEDIAMFEVLH
jgi:hypothetical protein